MNLIALVIALDNVFAHFKIENHALYEYNRTLYKHEYL